MNGARRFRATIDNINQSVRYVPQWDGCSERCALQAMIYPSVTAKL